MAANPIPLSGLARRLVEDNLLDEETAKSAAEEAQKTRVPFVTHLVQSRHHHMAGLRCLDRNVGCFKVPNLPNHHDIRVLSQE